MGNFGATPWGGSPPPGGAVFVSDIIYLAMRVGHLLKYSGMQTGTAQQRDAVLILNQIVDEWSARRVFAYANNFQTYTLTPNHQPHLIGPSLESPDFAAPIRPVEIDKDGAALILTTATPTVDVPIHVRDADWWNNQRVKGIATTVPTDLYYQPDFPNGALYLWPVPTFGYGIRLRLWSVIQQFAGPEDAFVAPPAYSKALTLTLAEEMCDAWAQPIPPGLPRRAMQARLAVIANNIKSPQIASADWGTRGRPRATFNYMTGQ